MSPKKTQTRERLILAARELFHEKGYDATSVAEILSKSGVNSGSFYYFFKTKEELLLAVLDLYVDWLWPMVIEPAFQQTDDPLERIFVILGGYRESLIQTDYRLGCPIGNLALELGDTLPAAREKIIQNFIGWRNAVRQCFVDLENRLPPDADPTRLATFVLTVMEGAVMQARAHHNLEPFDDSVAILRDYLERLLDDALD